MMTSTVRGLVRVTVAVIGFTAGITIGSELRSDSASSPPIPQRPTDEVRTFVVAGMVCPMCESDVIRRVGAISGIHHVKASWADHRVWVVVPSDGSAPGDAEIIHGISRAGTHYRVKRIED